MPDAVGAIREAQHDFALVELCRLQRVDILLLQKAGDLELKLHRVDLAADVALELQQTPQFGEHADLPPGQAFLQFFRRDDRDRPRLATAGLRAVVRRGGVDRQLRVRLKIEFPQVPCAVDGPPFAVASFVLRVAANSGPRRTFVKHQPRLGGDRVRPTNYRRATLAAGRDRRASIRRSTRAEGVTNKSLLGRSSVTVGAASACTRNCQLSPPRKPSRSSRAMEYAVDLSSTSPEGCSDDDAPKRNRGHRLPRGLAPCGRSPPREARPSATACWLRPKA